MKRLPFILFSVITLQSSMLCCSMKQISHETMKETPQISENNMLNLSLRKKYFDAIKAGTKTVEGRVNSAKFKDLKPGMKMSFTLPDTNEIMYCTVEAMYVYPTFEEMLKSEGVENMLPDVKTLKEAVEIYESFPSYKEEVKKHGALAIRVKVCSE